MENLVDKISFISGLEYVVAELRMEDCELCILIVPENRGCSQLIFLAGIQCSFTRNYR